MVLPIPTYLRDQTETAIALRLRRRVPGDLDVATGSFIGDVIDAVSMELAQVAIWCQATLSRGMVQTTAGVYLDYLGEARGVDRKAAVKSVVEVQFTGVNGTVIPIGTRVSTEAPAGEAPHVFETTAAATIAGGAVLVPAVNTRGGSAGNVIPNTITVMNLPIDGVTAVTNLLGATGGLDRESDEDLRARILLNARNPSAGGNLGDYLRWASEVPGVGGATALGATDGDVPPGEVWIWVAGVDGRAASQQTVDRVQEYIAPAHLIAGQAETLTVQNANGVTIEDRTDDDGTSRRMAYSAAGEGELRHNDLETILPRPGIWEIRVKLRADNAIGATAAVRIGVWNETTAAWADLADGDPTDATRTLTTTQIQSAFGWWSQDFYWNGTDALHARVVRLATDTTSVVWVDEFLYVSTFSRDDGSGLAPVGARVIVRSVAEVEIDVAADLDIFPEFDRAAVEASLEDALIDLVARVSKRATNRVLRYNDVIALLVDFPGIRDFENLTVNTLTANVVLAPHQVAVLDAVAWGVMGPLGGGLTVDDPDTLEQTWPRLDGLADA